MEDIFKCEICQTEFKHKSSLLNHMKKAKYIKTKLNETKLNYTINKK